MAIPAELAQRIEEWFDPGPEPTAHDDTGGIYIYHDLRVRAAKLQPALVAALESTLRAEVATDLALHLAYNNETLRPWEQIVAVARTAEAVHLAIVHSRQAPITLRCAPGALQVRRTKNLWKREVELEHENGVPTIVLGGGFNMKHYEAELEAVANAPVRPVTPPGWYPDPTGRRRVRWWDGTTWTSQAADGVDVLHDPL